MARFKKAVPRQLTNVMIARSSTGLGRSPDIWYVQKGRRHRVVRQHLKPSTGPA